jgi:hypothetical protein
MTNIKRFINENGERTKSSWWRSCCFVIQQMTNRHNLTEKWRGTELVGFSFPILLTVSCSRTISLHKFVYYLNVPPPGNRSRIRINFILTV